MPGLAPEQRLQKHKALRDWLRFQLQQTESTIQQLERQVEEDRRRQVARAA
ncbi:MULTISPECIES: hypothetical protein [Streptomyces]|uniref:Uncharacterized protein n=1 Tax=Streptomyces pratisoli TaxID=3139917 RepID=A0ACC6QV37_9ACTN|nr:hypothetical protein [Streptomyces sp. NBC_00259]